MANEFYKSLKKSYFLTTANDAICSAVSKAISLVDGANFKGNPSEKAFVSRKSFKIDDCSRGEFYPEISLDEVCRHDSINDCWIVVYDRVFDITHFFKEHPGGEEVLVESAGRDATIAFNSVGHSSEALKALEKYLIGILPVKERIYSNGGKKVLEKLATSLSLGT